MVNGHKTGAYGKVDVRSLQRPKPTSRALLSDETCRTVQGQKPSPLKGTKR